MSGALQSPDPGDGIALVLFILEGSHARRSREPNRGTARPRSRPNRSEPAPQSSSSWSPPRRSRRFENPLLISVAIPTSSGLSTTPGASLSCRG